MADLPTTDIDLGKDDADRPMSDLDILVEQRLRAREDDRPFVRWDDTKVWLEARSRGEDAPRPKIWRK